MNNRNGIVLFFLFLFLAVMVLLQVLSMIQADRLFERVNRLEQSVQNSAGSVSLNSSANKQTRDSNEGDWLVYGLGAEPANLNPVIYKDFYGGMVLGRIFEGLMEYDSDTLEFKPVLAQSYQVSEDGLSTTFRLKPDIHFSDGVPITADDVVFSYQTIINPGVDAANIANYYMNFKDVIKIDSRTVKFVMKEPYFKSFEMAAFTSILPKHVYQFKDPSEFNKHRTNPVGSGPYVFEKWDVGREISLRRNENYWGQRPKIDKVVFRIITNDVAAVQALRSHTIDFLEPKPGQYDALSRDKQFQEEFTCLNYYSPGAGYRYIGWNMNNSMFDDKRVRLAMTYLFDRQSILTQIFKGLGQVISGPFYTAGPQNDPNIKPWPFDPQKAKTLLEQAGWKDTNGDGILDKNGVSLKFRIMIVSGVQYQEQVAKLFKDEAAKVGIDVMLDPYEWSVFIERLNNREFDAMMGAWSGAVEEDPYQIWHSSQAAGRGSNHVAFKNPQADKLIEEARRTLDPAKRNVLYHEFARILHNEQPYTFLFTRPELRFIDKRFHNVKVHKLGIDEREWYVPKNEQRYK
jgi:peptide/nickel transport system substrate-binding protein